MCRARLTALGLVLLLSAGCFSPRENRISRLRTSSPTSGGDGIYLDYLLVERTAGDAYLDRKMWNEIDEMVIPVDARPVTRSNGFRVGVIGGLISPEIQTLIANPKNQQDVRRRQSAFAVPKPLTVGGVIPHAEFNVSLPNEEQPKAYKLDQVQCGLSITAWEGEGGKVRLEFVPEVSYHDKKHWIPPGAVGAGWLREKPLERFNDLGWEVSLSPSEYLILGTKYEAESTLGHRFFLGESNRQPVQRILILRVGKLKQTVPLGDFFVEESLRRSGGESKAVPLALQASSSTLRPNHP